MEAIKHMQKICSLKNGEENINKIKYTLKIERQWKNERKKKRTWSLHLRMAYLYRNTLLEKTKFLVESGFQLKVGSEVWMGACIHF